MLCSVARHSIADFGSFCAALSLNLTYSVLKLLPEATVVPAHVETLDVNHGIRQNQLFCSQCCHQLSISIILS